MSKRSLRPDPNFDQIVSKLFPDKEDCEEQQEKAGFAHAKRLCKKRRLREESVEGNDLDLEVGSQEKKIKKYINIKLNCHKNAPEEIKDTHKEKFVQTNNEATIEHLAKFVQTRLDLELSTTAGEEIKGSKKVSNIKLFLHPDSTNEDDLLVNHLTLEDIFSEKGGKDGFLKIFFSCDIAQANSNL